ncbi:MAG: type IX secretion system membrane protein PorP/SprF [Cytophagales bacterium]|nr:type IX secretion system membrane protein PorP/SprF [Cytophagales bacterium]
MKKIIPLIILIGVGFVSYSQQVPLFSQYMLNPYLVNPAVGGTSDHYDLKLGFRQQWVGIDGAPQTYYLSGHGHVGKDHVRLRGRHRNQNSWHHGLGFVILGDRTGPISQYTVRPSYAYDMAINRQIRISFGVALGVKLFNINGSLLEPYDKGTFDYTLANSRNTIAPDGSIGAWIYHKYWYAGASIDQIFFAGLKSPYDGFVVKNTQTGTAESYYAPSDVNLVNRLTQHYYITGGGIFHPSREIAIIPSAMIRTAYGGGGFAIDVNTKVRYNNLVWGGMSLRNLSEFAVLIGVLLNKKFEIGYSYDYTLSLLSAKSNGSHEILLGYRLEPRAHILSPSDFW